MSMGVPFILFWLVFVMIAFMVLSRIVRWVFTDETRSTMARLRDRSGCPRSGCGAVNPRHARFCARCGQPLVSEI